MDLLLKGYESPNFQRNIMPYSPTPVSISHTSPNQVIPDLNNKLADVEYINQVRK